MRHPLRQQVAAVRSRTRPRRSTKRTLPRAAAAATLVKLDRWQALQLSLYQELQPNFVELSDATWSRLEGIDRRLLAAVPPARAACRMAVITLGLPFPTDAY